MKKIMFFIALMTCVSTVRAQDRVDAAPEQLTSKSQEIKNALFWEQNKNGKWVSRKNTKRPYLGEGVAVENFNSTFIGTYKNVRYIFVDEYQVMGSSDYSFPFFLKLTDTLISAGNEESPEYAICAKRTMSDGKDVVRFLLAPKCLPELLDLNYFEVTYEEFQKLFIQDKNNTYK